MISGSRDLGVEEAVTEEVLCREVGLEVEVAGSRLETEARRQGLGWLEAGLCWEAVCTWESCWRTVEEWTAGEGGWKLARGAN